MLRSGQLPESLLAAAPVAVQLYSILFGSIMGIFGQGHAHYPAQPSAAGNSRGRGRGKRGRGGGGRGRGNRSQGRGMSCATGLDNRFGMLTVEDDWDDD